MTRKGLLQPSPLGKILDALPALEDYSLPKGTFVPYKGREYAWLPVSAVGTIQLTDAMLAKPNLSVGGSLMSIRSSNIAFTMAAKGPLIQRAKAYPGEIEIF